MSPKDIYDCVLFFLNFITERIEKTRIFINFLFVLRIKKLLKFGIQTNLRKMTEFFALSKDILQFFPFLFRLLTVINDLFFTVYMRENDDKLNFCQFFFHKLDIIFVFDRKIVCSSLF